MGITCSSGLASSVRGKVNAVGSYSVGLIAQATLLPVNMSVSRATLILTLTLLMCLTSGAIAMRKLQAADPADIF
jgi:putative ABC transport system permease protein